jgi:hypothetical protein
MWRDPEYPGKSALLCHTAMPLPAAVARYCFFLAFNAN